MDYATANPDVRDEKMSYLALFDVEGRFTPYVYLYSEEEQTVYISAYSYDDQHLRNGACT